MLVEIWKRVVGRAFAEWLVELLAMFTLLEAGVDVQGAQSAGRIMQKTDVLVSFSKLSPPQNYFIYPPHLHTHIHVFVGQARHHYPMHGADLPGQNGSSPQAART